MPDTTETTLQPSETREFLEVVEKLQEAIDNENDEVVYYLRAALDKGFGIPPKPAATTSADTTTPADPGTATDTTQPAGDQGAAAATDPNASQPDPNAQPAADANTQPTS